MTAGQHKSTVVLEARVGSLERELERAVRKVDKMSRALERSNKQAQRAARQMSTMGKAGTMASNAIGGAQGLAMSAIAAGYAIDRVAERSIAWSNVNKKLAIDTRLAADAVGWQTDRLVLSESAAKLNSQAILTSSESYAEWAGYVALLADKHGVDLTQAINAGTKAILKGNGKGNEAIGIYYDQVVAIDQYAKSQNKATTEVTLAEKQQLALQGQLEQMRALAFAYGETVESSAHGWARLKNKAIDAIDELSDAAWNMNKDFEQFGREVEGVFIDLGFSLEDAELRTYQLGKAAEIVTSIWVGRFGNAKEAIDELSATTGVAGNQAFADAQKQARAEKQRLDDSRRGLDNARAVARAYHEAIAAARREEQKPKKKGGKAKETFALEELEIKRLDRLIEKNKELGAAVELLQARRLRLAVELARKKKDIDREEQLLHKAALERLKQQKEIEESVARFVAQRDEGARQAETQQLEQSLALRQRAVALATNEEDRAVAQQAVRDLEFQQMEHELELRREILRARFPEDEAERLQIQQDLRQIDHEQKMIMLERETEFRVRAYETEKQIEAQRRALGKRILSDTVSLHGATTSIVQSSTNAVIQSADTETAAGRKRARNAQKAQAMMAWGVAALDTVRAISAYASYNYVQGALYTASAVGAGITGAMLWRGDVGEGSLPAGAGASAGAVSGGPSAGGRGGGEITDTPGSRPAPPTSAGAAPDRDRDEGRSSTTLQGDIYVLGEVSEETGRRLIQGMEDAKASLAVSA